MNKHHPRKDFNQLKMTHQMNKQLYQLFDERLASEHFNYVQSVCAVIIIMARYCVVSVTET